MDFNLGFKGLTSYDIKNTYWKMQSTESTNQMQQIAVQLIVVGPVGPTTIKSTAITKLRR